MGGKDRKSRHLLWEIDWPLKTQFEIQQRSDVASLSFCTTNHGKRSKHTMACWSRSYLGFVLEVPQFLECHRIVCHDFFRLEVVWKRIVKQAWLKIKYVYHLDSYRSASSSVTSADYVFFIHSGTHELHNWFRVDTRGPLLVTTGVITSESRVNKTQHTHLFSAIYQGEKTPPITGRGPPW